MITMLRVQTHTNSRRFVTDSLKFDSLGATILCENNTTNNFSTKSIANTNLSTRKLYLACHIFGVKIIAGISFDG